MTDVTRQTVTGGPPIHEFLGRRRELAALRSDIERAGLDTLAGRPAPRGRVLLVAGRPGTGRTALAEKLAADLVDDGRYPDGVLRARLTDHGGRPVPLERTVRDLLAGLGPAAPAAPAGCDDDELADVLRATLRERRALLLLDDVATADQLADLVPDGRESLVVAVARGPLTGVPDVRPCALSGLDRHTAVRLLARGAGPVRVTVDPRAAEALAEACADLPAALVMAAGWLAAHPEATVAEAVRRIHEAEQWVFDGVDAAGAEGAGDDPAAAALRRAFALVHTTLPKPAARLLRLAVTAPAGLVDEHTAAALLGCPLDTAGALLDGLALLGLLRPAGGRAGPPDPERAYLVPGCLTPLLRALLDARERPGEALLARARLLERTVRRLRACRAVTEPSGAPDRAWLAGLPASLRFADAAAARDWVAARRPVLLTAARQAVDDGELDTLARRLVAALGRALAAHLGEAADPDRYRLHEMVLAVADRQGLARERAAALLDLGDLDAAGGRFETALERYRLALETARATHVPDPLAVGRALESIAGTYAELADWQRAADWYGRALALALSRGDLPVTARLHGRIAAALAHEEEWGEALRSWRAAAAAHRRRGDDRARARALSEAARALERLGRDAEAQRTGEAALRLAQRAGDRRLQADLRLRLAECAERAGRPAVAGVHRAAASRLLAGVRGTRDGGGDGRGSGEPDGEADGEAGREPAGSCVGPPAGARAHAEGHALETQT